MNWVMVDLLFTSCRVLSISKEKSTNFDWWKRSFYYWMRYGGRWIEFNWMVELNTPRCERSAVEWNWGISFLRTLMVRKYLLNWVAERSEIFSKRHLTVWSRLPKTINKLTECLIFQLGTNLMANLMVKQQKSVGQVFYFPWGYIIYDWFTILLQPKHMLLNIHPISDQSIISMKVNHLCL